MYIKVCIEYCVWGMYFYIIVYTLLCCNCVPWSVFYCLLWTATTLVSLSTHEVFYLLNCIGYLYSDSSTSCLIRALVPYHSHLLLLLNHVVILLNYVVLRALWKIDVHLISTLVNKSLYYCYLLLLILIVLFWDLSKQDNGIV